ncbi:hypothetical protein ACFQLX_04435 [Streptomyces polyrhachis]|uniref:Uncharacterized protein n=1 Tax=Streptomyces polyrhachis TaxID=1282885 RepID=A0ABW2GF57_9ACTN
MEPNRGQNITPVNAAATDPSALPGLIVPRPRTTEEPQEAPAPEEESAGAAESEVAEPEAAEPVGLLEKAAPDTSADAAEDSEVAPESVELEFSDRRGSVVADAAGMRFTLDDTEAEFDWEEIGAVEYATSRFGRRLTVTVHLRGRKLYETDVTAPDKAALARWTKSLDELMDARFDD